MRPVQWTHWLLILAMLTLLDCTSSSEASQTVPSIGLSYELKEVGEGISLTLQPGTFNKVDANSDLVVSFHLLSSQEVAAASPAWQQVQKLLGEVDACAQKRAELAAWAKRVNLKDAAELKRMQKESAKFTADIAVQVAAWQATLGKMGLTGDEISSVFTGRFDLRGKSDDPYANLTLWLRERIVQLNRDAETFFKSRDRYGVTVEAFHDPIGGNRKALHVEGYDRLPIGELRPIDRTGLKMTPAEQQRFNMEMQQAQAVAAAITELSAKGNDIRKSTFALFDQLRLKIDALEKGLQDVQDWDVKLGNAAKKLREFAAGEQDVAKKQALSDLAGKIDALLQKKSFILQRIDELNRLKLELTSVGTGDSITPGQVGKLFDDIASFLSNAAQIKTIAQDVRSVFDAIKTLSPSIQQEISEHFAEQFTRFSSLLGDELPKTAEAIGIVRDIARKNLQTADATDNLTGLGTPLISRGLDDLPDARIELARAGLTQGDNIAVRIKIAEQPAAKRGETNPDESEKLVQETTYKTTAVLMGWHRVISADLIFARALSGDETATKWKPNVSASANWHYTYRERANWWEKAVNGVNPGLGFHLASLNQGNEGVEFGLGVNLSLFSGLLNGGYGFNLSVREKPYVYVGIDLLNVLNQARGLAK